MLRTLENVQGFMPFMDFIKKRVKCSRDWIAEIKALYEINKDAHPLIEICSYKPSAPEGLFRIGDKTGWIESAFIRHVFCQNVDRQKLVNRINGYFKPLEKYLRGKFRSFVIVVNVRSTNIVPADSDLAGFKQDVVGFFRDDKEKKNLYILAPFGSILVFCQDDRTMTLPYYRDNFEVTIEYKSAGSIIRGHNVNLQRKALQLIRNKRKQHRAIYGSHYKVYYFFVDSPRIRSDTVNISALRKEINDNEVLVICAVHRKNNNFVEDKIVVTKPEKIRNLFDFTNQYINSCYIGQIDE